MRIFCWPLTGSILSFCDMLVNAREDKKERPSWNAYDPSLLLPGDASQAEFLPHAARDSLPAFHSQ